MIDGAPLRVGDRLFGHCGGYFGRDSFEDKRVEAIGMDWVVARDVEGVPLFASIDPELLRRYRTPPDET